MHKHIHREMDVHGSAWMQIHSGYFADPKVAENLIVKVLEAIALSRPEVVVDLGGGTGFLLEELIRRRIDPAIRLVDLDLSPAQLSDLHNPRISIFNGSMLDFRRGDFDQAAQRFLFMTRSTLHYVGRPGLGPLLRHLRAQMRPGEFWVHQTACFDAAQNASCLNRLYELMNTEKWYPTALELDPLLASAGWSIQSFAPCPSLPLTAEDLQRRYKLSQADLARIRADLFQRYGEIPNVIQFQPQGFCAYLHYKIYVCRAA